MLKSKIENLNELEASIENKKELFEEEISKPEHITDDASKDILRMEIKKKKSKQLKLLNEIKIILESSID